MNPSFFLFLPFLYFRPLGAYVNLEENAYFANIPCCLIAIRDKKIPNFNLLQNFLQIIFLRMNFRATYVLVAYYR